MRAGGRTNPTHLSVIMSPVEVGPLFSVCTVCLPTEVTPVYPRVVTECVCVCQQGACWSV